MNPEGKFIFFLLISNLVTAAAIEFSLSFLLQGARGIIAFIIFTIILMRLIHITLPKNIREIIDLLRIRLNRVIYISGVISGLAILTFEGLRYSIHPILLIAFVWTSLIYSLAIPLIAVKFFSS